MEHVPGVLEGLGATPPCSQVSTPSTNIQLLTPPHRHGTTSVDRLSVQEERKVQEVLLDSLEQFIAGKADVAGVFQQLSEADTPPAICGHVFKPGGETTLSSTC